MAAAPLEAPQHLDPRIRRTRELLQQSLARLLEDHEFEKLSVQDITDAATVNRATFYAHYPDKFALLECMVASRFNELLASRGVVFDGTCGSAIQGIVLGVCDFLAQTPLSECERQRHLEPHLESAVVAVIRGMLLGGLSSHSGSANSQSGSASPEMLASTGSWAIYGAAKEWVRTPERVSSEEITPAIVALVAPILSLRAIPSAKLPA